MTVTTPKPKAAQEIDMQHQRALNALLKREFYKDMRKPLLMDLLKKRLKP